MPEMNAPVDLTIFRTITEGNLDTEKELMGLFVEQSDRSMETLRQNCAVAGENKSWTDTAHMLKGGAGGIGAEKLRQLCSEAQHFKGAPDARSALFTKIDGEYARVKEHLRKMGLLP